MRPENRKRSSDRARGRQRLCSTAESCSGEASCWPGAMGAGAVGATTGAAAEPLKD